MRKLPRDPDGATEKGAALTSDDMRKIAREEYGKVLLQLGRSLLGETDHFSTQGGDRHAPPEYRGRPKRWRADAPKIPGAVRVGRWWTVSRPAYVAWLESQRTTALPGIVSAPAPASKPWSPEDSLVGLRVVGDGR